MQHFGEHLMIDGYGGNEVRLNDRELVSKCLNELPTLIGMRKLAEPEIYLAEDNRIKDPGGWSGIVVVAESHISIHTFPKRKFISADVYTCKNGLDKDFVIKFFQDTFQLQEVETNFVERGKKYPVNNLV